MNLTTITADEVRDVDLNILAGNIAIINSIELVIAPSASMATTVETSGTIGVGLTNDSVSATAGLGNGFAGVTAILPIMGGGAGIIAMLDYAFKSGLLTSGLNVVDFKRRVYDWRSYPLSNRPWTSQVMAVLSQIVDTGVDVDIKANIWYQMAALTSGEIGAFPTGQRIIRVPSPPADGRVGPVITS